MCLISSAEIERLKNFNHNFWEIIWWKDFTNYESVYTAPNQISYDVARWVHKWLQM